MQTSYGNQAGIRYSQGKFEAALELYKKLEVICLELGNIVNLQRSYQGQALTLVRLGHLAKALVFLRRSETTRIELGIKQDLGYCYWQWASLARAQGDRATEKQKLQQALDLFTELNMPRERDAVQAELDQVNPAS